MTDRAAANWEERFSEEEYFFGKEPNEFLAEHAGELPSGAVLCVAEGEGRNAVFLASTGREVTSVDLTIAGVTKTLRLAVERGVTVDARVGDLAEFDLGEERWDAVVSIFAHMPLPVRTGLHRRVVAALKPGGVLLLEAYTPDQVGRGTGGPSDTAVTMTLAALRDELSGLEILHGLETERPVHEGGGHAGLGSVVQVIARKSA